jgi:rhodanese-related sulfurtransferase
VNEPPESRSSWRAAARIALLAALCAAGANLVHPHGIPWTRDAAESVAAAALERGIPLLRRDALRAGLRSGDLLVFDARPEADYNAGHIEGALPFPFEDAERGFDQWAALWADGPRVAAYCGGEPCDDALLLLEFLRARGVTNVALYAAGYEGWMRSGGEEEAP